VLVLIGSGTGAAVLHMPTFASFWQTSYGQTLIVKICLLAAAMLLASVNLLRNKPRLAAYRQRPELGPGAATLLRRLVSGEVLLVATVVGAAAVLSSLAPPSKALASIGQASAHVGPGNVLRVVNRNGYKLTFRVAPNRAAVPNSFSVQITRNGKPVRNADVTTSFTMLDMEMGQQAYRLPETSPGTYEHRAVPALVMVGHWGLGFDVAIPGRQPFTVLLVDHATG
jgi:copper transport protein